MYRFDEMNKLSVFLFVCGLSGLLAGCLKGEEYPPQPVLTFKSMITRPDSAIIVMEFTDGDGNFGLNQGDTAGSFDNCLRQYNLYCEYYELQSGEWVQFAIDPCADPEAVPFYYRVPFVEPTGQIKAQKGEVRIVITPFYYFPGEFDTCRFEVSAVDRGLNVSNTIRTRSFLKP